MSLFNRNEWQEHVRDVQNSHPNWTLKEVLKHAKKTYRRKR